MEARTMTEADRLLVLAKGATARHAKSAHLWKRAVRETAKELERDLQRHKALSCKPLPLFEQVNP